MPMCCGGGSEAQQGSGQGGTRSVSASQFPSVPPHPPNTHTLTHTHTHTHLVALQVAQPDVGQVGPGLQLHRRRGVRVGPSVKLQVRPVACGRVSQGVDTVGGSRCMYGGSTRSEAVDTGSYFQCRQRPVPTDLAGIRSSPTSAPTRWRRWGGRRGRQSRWRASPPARNLPAGASGQAQQ